MSQRVRLGFFALLFLVLWNAAASHAQVRGGSAVVGLYANISSLDPHFQVSHIGGSIFFCIYEGLVTIDDKGKAIPMLAKSWQVSQDGKIYDFEIRRQIRFHNGKLMTARDVAASIQRYLRISPDRSLLEIISHVEVKSEFEVSIVLKRASSTFLDRLASPVNPVSIIPAEQAGKPLNRTEYIGTGPFRFVDWVPDSYVRLARFGRYTADTDYPSPTGLGGQKTPYLDEITFRFMAEPSSRVAALEAGEIQLAEQIPALSAARLAKNPKLRIERLDNFNMPALFINHAAAPTNTVKLRRAIQIALDLHELMAGATDGAFTLDPSWLWWGDPAYSTMGGSLYNVHDTRLAKKLLAETGYGGERIDLLIPNISLHSKIGTILLEQLRGIGLNVRPVSVDYATLVSAIASDKGWHLALNGFRAAPFLGAYAYEPIFSGVGNWAHANPDEDRPMLRLWSQFEAAQDQKARNAIWADIQALTYQNVTMAKLGNESLLVGSSVMLHGYKPFAGGERMWNVWLSPVVAAGKAP
jgi:peptide/nickel transport system substrate-binding protein